MKAKVFVLLGALFLIVSCCFADDSSDVTKAVGGSANMAVITNPDSINVWRTIGSLAQAGRQGYRTSDIYSRAGKPIPVSKNLAAQLAKLLDDPHTYLRPGTPLKGCVPVPEVLVAYARGNKEVDTYLCFECDVLVVGDAQSDFDRARPAILKVVKKMLPNDYYIQSLKDQ
jgi:hypothetical protein